MSSSPTFSNHLISGSNKSCHGSDKPPYPLPALKVSQHEFLGVMPEVPQSCCSCDTNMGFSHPELNTGFRVIAVLKLGTGILGLPPACHQQTRLRKQLLSPSPCILASNSSITMQDEKRELGDPCVILDQS